MGDTGGGSTRPAIGVDRMATFTDGVVAIAMTLLILPLLDAVTSAADAGLDGWGYVTTYNDLIGPFLISFTTIARHWRSHHRLFLGIDREVPWLFGLNSVWLGAIVFLPVATAMTSVMQADASVYGIYIGTMLGATVMMAAMTVLVRRHPQAWREGAHVPARRVLLAIMLCLLTALALVLAVLVPGLGYWALLILVLVRPASWLAEAALARSGHALGDG